MMYIAVYPVCYLRHSSATCRLSVSHTGRTEYSLDKRVRHCTSLLSLIDMLTTRLSSYEEQSLGVFEAGPADEDEEPDLEKAPQRERIGKYFGWHLRRQVAFDIWWLVWAIFAICIIERTKIMDDENAPWFNLFRIGASSAVAVHLIPAADVGGVTLSVFELVSAFGGIGLTLGIPTHNYAFTGAFGPLSKLVVIIIMVRGRHRGLPVAIDRASECCLLSRPKPDADVRGGQSHASRRLATSLGGECQDGSCDYDFHFRC